ncbi:hypothetical protein Dgeo_2294 [Deinococcus geothermalis DSM 11300]|uniref:Lipoprotein n=1 Tax=Deinococcus geothermalis (strain DSM 11300 / CIP 105573 / AG-3a) TaxID=319795 RepID=Q1IVZ6_DEIGD|nr:MULTISPECIES: hypothetical protein [Deinococcus]ABF46588.1 hypothetical protein Dgeo_2294 [Deinococcus geothermalis DSM 11300]MBI0445107.1 hypothetical protein [Deinococcus sp. DB0503]
MRPAPLLLLPLLLAACGSQEVKAPDAYDVSGTISGDWGAGPRLRLALVGTGLPGAVTNDSRRGQNIVGTGAGTWQFGFDLPGVPAVAGVYQVVVFDDANNDATFNPLTEKFARNRQWLIYSAFSGTFPSVRVPEFLPGGGEELLPEMHVERGWNLYNRNLPLSGSNPSPAAKVSGYDLSR